MITVVLVSELICSYKPTPDTHDFLLLYISLSNAGGVLFLLAPCYIWSSIIICCSDGNTWFLLKQANRKASTIDNNFSNNLFAAHVITWWRCVYIAKWSPGCIFISNIYTRPLIPVLIGNFIVKKEALFPFLTQSEEAVDLYSLFILIGYSSNSSSFDMPSQRKHIYLYIQIRMHM